MQDGLLFFLIMSRGIGTGTYAFDFISRTTSSTVHLTTVCFPYLFHIESVLGFSHSSHSSHSSQLFPSSRCILMPSTTDLYLITPLPFVLHPTFWPLSLRNFSSHHCHPTKDSVRERTMRLSKSVPSIKETIPTHLFGLHARPPLVVVVCSEQYLWFPLS
jgi:hypothetical protein